MGSARSSRRVTIIGALLLLPFGACVADNDQVGLLRTPDGPVEILYVRCVDRSEVLRSVQLRDDSGAVMWKIVDERPISESRAQPAVQRITIGEAPRGFVEEVSLETALSPSETYHLSIDGVHQEGSPFVRFELDDLSEENVFGPVEARTDEFIEGATKECEAPRPPLGGFFAGGSGGFRLLLALTGVGLVAIAIGRRASSRKTTQPR